MRSARECLIGCIDSWLSPEDAIKLVDDYAHELAEDLRVWADRRDVGHDFYSPAGIDEAADYIDPQVG